MPREIEPANRAFPSTHWSAIDRAGREDARGARPQLSDLLARYLPALRAHLLNRRSVPATHVDDLLQSFISSKVLESDLITRADRSKGKFRTLLATALDRFVISQQRHDRAAKRGADRTQSLETAADVDHRPDPGAGIADTFDTGWARQILREGIGRMRARCESEGRLDIWGVFNCRVLQPALEGAEPVDYQQIVERFSYRSPSQLWNAVRTGKQLFAAALRGVIGEYAESNQEIEDEMRDLIEICSRMTDSASSVSPDAQDGEPPAYP